MADIPTDLYKNKLVEKEELIITYEGQSFNNKMEIEYLIEQLKSTESLIKDVTDKLYESKQISVNSENLKIYLKLKKGSFEEMILIALLFPIAANVIGDSIVSLFKKLLKKKDDNNSNIKIENMITNYYIVKNISSIISPLQDKKDMLRIYSSYNPNRKVDVFLEDKDLIRDVLEEISKNISFEKTEEDFFGKLSRVDINKDRFGFTLEGSNKSIPAVFQPYLNLDDIKNILGETTKIKAIAYRRLYNGKKELYKLEIKEYKIKEKKNLTDFLNR